MRYEPCPSCRGSGLQNGISGIEDCYACRGNAEVPVRDERGRFVASTPENVECRTCGGDNVICAHGGRIQHHPVSDRWISCPDCTPENVECRACDGKGYVPDDTDNWWPDCPRCGGEGTVIETRPLANSNYRPCPDCTPENVEEPT